MKGLLRLLWRGAGLRHLPITLGDPNDPLVTLELHGPAGETRDVTADHVPVSLRPLILGIWNEAPHGAPDATTARHALVVRDTRTGKQLGVIMLTPAGTLPLTRGILSLFSMSGCRNATASLGVRWWRYALAWRDAQRAPRRGDGLCMSAADLRCLNVYYMAARPVYLIGVALGEQTNLFPMDLVGRIGSGDYLLALRATSPASELMETSRVITMSAAPSDHLARCTRLARIIESQASISPRCHLRYGLHRCTGDRSWRRDSLVS